MAVIVPIVGEYQGTAFRRAEQDIEKLGRTANRQTSHMSKFGASFKKSIGGGLLFGGGAAAGAAVAGLIADVGRLAIEMGQKGVQAALDEEKALAGLARQVKATNNVFDSDAVSKFVDDMQFATNVADTELYTALTTLTAATGSLTTAQRLLPTAIDASTASGKDLSSVTSALSKAAVGNTSALKRMFPALSSTALATHDLAIIQDELNRLYGGAAVTNLQTTAGQMENLKIAVDEAAQAFGEGFLSGLLGTSTNLKDIVDVLRDSQPAIQSFGQGIGTLATALFPMVKFMTEQILAARMFIGTFTGNDEAVNAAAQELINFGIATGEITDAWATASATVSENPIVATVTVVDPYGQALGNQLAPYKKVIETIIQGIKDARAETEKETADAEAAAEAAAQRLRMRINARTQEIADRARTQLQSAREEVANFRSITDDFKRGITEFGAVSSLQAEASVPISAEMITANMRQRLAAITAFSTKIKELKTKGLPASVLVDIINQGPFDGLRYAEAILASKTAISDISSLTAGINRQAGIIGNIGAEATTGTTLGNLQAATSFVVQAGGINITVNGEVSAKTVKEIKDAVRDSLKRVSREAKGSRKPGGRG